MKTSYDEDVLAVRDLFERFEKAESVEQKTDFFDQAMSLAKEIIEESEDVREVKLANNLMRTYWQKLVRYIVSYGEKTTEDLITLLVSSYKNEYIEELKSENPAMYERYKDFLGLVAKDKQIMDALLGVANPSN